MYYLFRPFLLIVLVLFIFKVCNSVFAQRVCKSTYFPLYEKQYETLYSYDEGAKSYAVGLYKMDVFPRLRLGTFFSNLIKNLNHDFRLAANTMETLQGRSSGSSRRSSSESERSSGGSGRKSLGSGRRKDTKLRSEGVIYSKHFNYFIIKFIQNFPIFYKKIYSKLLTIL